MAMSFMAPRAPSPTNLLRALIAGLFCFSCQPRHQSRLHLPNAHIRFVGQDVSCQGKPFTGILEGISPFDNQNHIASYLNGKLTGPDSTFYGNGTLQKVACYSQGELADSVLEWWPNGKLLRCNHYAHGLNEGLQEEWYATGQLARRNWYVNGQESGPQTLYYENGNIRANYYVKNGRHFGNNGTKHCTGKAQNDAAPAMY